MNLPFEPRDMPSGEPGGGDPKQEGTCNNPEGTSARVGVQQRDVSVVLTPGCLLQAPEIVQECQDVLANGADVPTEHGRGPCRAGGKVIREDELQRRPVLVQLGAKLDPLAAFFVRGHVAKIRRHALLNGFTKLPELTPVVFACLRIRINQCVADVNRCLKDVAADQRYRICRISECIVFDHDAMFDIAQAANELKTCKRPQANQNGKARNECSAD